MLIAIYKEKGPTSRDVLNIIKKETGENKIGHGGTLDPLAEGVLIVGIGKEDTKKLHKEEFNEKEYEAVIFLGENSITDDNEGEKSKVNVKKSPKIEEIKDIVKKFIGVTMQIPPFFSAVKIKGKESYKLARKGVFLETKPRKAEIKSIKIKEYNYPFLKITVITGRGVYIRSLARDIGKELKTGAYLYSLIRTRVGKFTTNDCVGLSYFKK
jgi:tRNA pseudouridine55 synthase